MRFDAFWINFETAEHEVCEGKRYNRSTFRYTEKDPFADEGDPAPYFRKTFELPAKRIAKAELEVTALGAVKAYLNGRPVANDYLVPGFSDFYKRIPVYTFDVAPMLSERNALALVCGDGWAVGSIGGRMERNNYGKRIYVAARLTVEYGDGTKFSLRTDHSWKAAAGEIRSSDIYRGETVDHRLSLGAFSEYDYDDSAWKPITATNSVFGDSFTRLGDSFTRLTEPARAEYVTVKHVLAAKCLGRASDGSVIYDFGQNAAGVVSVTARGERGASLTVRHGEMLRQDGTLYTGNLRGARATDTFILAGEGEEHFRPLFTFHGFRYAAVEISGKAEITDIRFEVMYSDLKAAGEFRCSSELVDRIYLNSVWSQRSNFLYLPTDCPQRDERLGWTGDAQIFSGSAIYNMDCKRFFEKYMCDVRDSQLGNGAVPGTAPVVIHHSDGAEDMARISAAWGDAVTIIPYKHYLAYGDRRILTDNLFAMKQWVRYCVTDSDDFVRSAADNYGDWLNVDCETDLSLLATAYLVCSAGITTYACMETGDCETDEFREIHGLASAAFRRAFLKEDGRLSSDTQTAYSLALAFGIMSADEVRPHMVRLVESADGHMTGGFVGIKYMLPVLCEVGRSDLAYRVLTQTSYPGWGYAVRNGATTSWERWNSYTAENGFGDESMNSFNHYSLGSCCEWMYSHMLGISPCREGVGYRKALIRPFVDFSGKITSASGSYDSARGKISVSWNSGSREAEYNVKAEGDTELLFDFSAYSSAERVGEGRFILKK